MIEIKGISKSYGRHKVLNNISFSVKPGDCIGIIGANGTGKTTLLSIISGLSKPDSGEILLDGNNILGSSKKARDNISYVPQENPLISELSAIDNLSLWYNGKKKDLVKQLESGILKELGINEFANKKVVKMSGGMKKRLSIGIALLNNPSLLILDEPSAALDIAAKHDIRNYMKYYTSKLNGSIIVVSHDQNELSVCNRLFLLKDGCLSEISTNLTDDELVKLL